VSLTRQTAQPSGYSQASSRLSPRTTWRRSPTACRLARWDRRRRAIHRPARLSNWWGVRNWPTACTCGLGWPMMRLSARSCCAVRSCCERSRCRRGIRADRPTASPSPQTPIPALVVCSWEALAIDLILCFVRWHTSGRGHSWRGRA